MGRQDWEQAAGAAAGLAVGDTVEVLIAQPYDWNKREEWEPEWTPGFRVTGLCGAADRDFRVDVEGPKTYRACAPECVRRTA